MYIDFLFNTNSEINIKTRNQSQCIALFFKSSIWSGVFTLDQSTCSLKKRALNFDKKSEKKT